MFSRVFLYWYAWLVPVLGGLLCILIAAKLEVLPKRIAVPGTPLSINVPSELSWRVNNDLGVRHLELKHADGKIHVVSAANSSGINLGAHLQRSKDVKVLHAAPAVVLGHKVYILLLGQQADESQLKPLLNDIVASLQLID